jgi:cellulose synthase/poly-beta-1,6-N-acetylglucosamine synthase-like glycosyltransferase
MMEILIYLEWILLGIFGFNILYLGIYALASFLYKSPKTNTNPSSSPIAVVFCAYKEGEVILQTAIDALKYISKEDKVFVVADQIEATVIQELKSAGVEVIEVVFEQSTKVKSLKAACEIIKPSQFPLMLVMDIDNELTKGVLDAIKSTYQAGYQSIQCHRTAKNKETGIAILDGISEEINNTIFRKGHAALGLSSALIGSGMAFDTKVFSQFIQTNKAIGGFDKELEIQLTLHNIKVAYLDKALVLDEKVSDAKNLQNQRKRWLSDQYIYLKHFLKNMPLKHFFNLNIVNKLIQYAIVPRVLLLGLTLFMWAFHWLFLYEFQGYWLILSLGLHFTLAIAVPRRLYTLDTFKALLQLPKAFFILFGNIFKLKNANKSFIHTSHKTHKP